MRMEMCDGADKEVWKDKKSEGDGAAVFKHTAQTNSVLFYAASDAFHLFGAHLQKISSGKWRAWICLPGTRWDCVITVGS